MLSSSTLCSAESQPELVEEFLGPIRLWALILSGERGREKAAWGQGSAGILLPCTLLGRLLVEPSAPRKGGRVVPRGVAPRAQLVPRCMPWGCRVGARVPRDRAGGSPRCSGCRQAPALAPHSVLCRRETPAPGRCKGGAFGEGVPGAQTLPGEPKAQVPGSVLSCS